MQKIKIFMGSATADSLPELEESINSWVEKEKVEIKNIFSSIRQVPPGERASLTAEIMDQLVISILYETK